MADTPTFDNGKPIIELTGGQPRIRTGNLLLNWRCEDCDSESQQPLTDIPEAGGAICEHCGEDMELLDHVSIADASGLALPQ